MGRHWRSTIANLPRWLPPRNSATCQLHEITSSARKKRSALSCVGVKLRRRFQNLPKMRKTGCRGNRHDAIQRETARCILLRRRTPGIIDDVNSLRRCRWLTGSRTVLKKLTRNLAKCADWRSRELADDDATSCTKQTAKLASGPGPPR